MVINGKEFSLEDIGENSLPSLIHYLKLKPEAIAVERNGVILERSGWENVRLEEKDRLEIIKFIGGG